MAPTSLLHPNGTTNGLRPSPIPVRPSAALAVAVEELADLREQLKRLSTRERELTSLIITTLRAEGGRTIETPTAVAVLDFRRTLKPDPGLFIEAVGVKAACAALSVRVEDARKLIGGDDLAAISETATTPALTVRRSNG